MVPISAHKNKHIHKTIAARAFTLVELLIVITIIGVIGTISVLGFNGVQKNARDQARDSQTTIIANALEKYYDDNNEYPSVALATSQSVDTVKQKLKLSDASVLKFPLATTATSIATSDPSPTKLVYSANTTNTTKNTQCQTDISGYCDGFQLQYKKELDGSVVVVKSLHDSFTPIAGTAACAADETQSGNTCTKTYAATSQPGSYTCPSGGTLSGSTCTNTYSASYASGSGSYTCPSGGTLSGTTCTVSNPATYTSGGYSCPNGGSVLGSSCTTSADMVTNYRCSHPDFDTMMSQWTCLHNRPAYTTSGGCTGAGYTWSSGSCKEYHSTVEYITGVCPSGFSPNASYSYCERAATAYPATYSCPSGGTLSGTSCVSSYAATYTSGSYYCPNGGTLNGSNCTYPASNDWCTPPLTPASAGTCYDPNTGGYVSSNSTYTCLNGGTLSGTTCTYSATYVSSGGYYYCSGGGSLSGTTCTSSYAATQSGSYYYCASGGTLSGTTCTYSYTLP